MEEEEGEEEEEEEEDQEEEDNDADFDGTTLVGRWVMKFFKEENNWFLGQITGARRSRRRRLGLPCQF
jgi:hypothetical protein